MEPLTRLRVVMSGLVSVQALTEHYGLSKSTLYELIKSDPTFPYVNVGLRKKYMIDGERFEMWLKERTEKQKSEQFGLPTASGLLEKYRK
jgi:Helix-turn-helix domain